MRLFATIRALFSFDLDQRQKAFDQEVTFDDTDAATAAIPQSGEVLLPPSAASQPFGFGSVTAASLLLIVAYDEIRVQLGGNTAPPIAVRPVPASAPALVTSVYQRAAQPGVLLLRGRVDSLFLTNPSSTAPARAFVAVVGNAT